VARTAAADGKKRQKKSPKAKRIHARMGQRMWNALRAIDIPSAYALGWLFAAPTALSFSRARVAAPGPFFAGNPRGSSMQNAVPFAVKQLRRAGGGRGKGI